MNQTYLKFKTRVPFYFLVTCFFCFACKDDAVVEAVVEIPTCYLTSRNSMSTNGEHWDMTATYNSNYKLLTSSSNFYGTNQSFDITSYEYNQEGKISEITNHQGKTIFSYDPNGNWIESNNYNSSNQHGSKQIYDINSSGQVAKWSYYYPSTVLLFYRVYEYSNSTTYNVSSEKDYDASGILGGMTEYEYDTMNPILTPDFTYLIFPRTHNVIKTTHKDNVGLVLFSVNDDYTYNEYGYPNKSTTTFSTSPTSYTTEYEYECL